MNIIKKIVLTAVLAVAGAPAFAYTINSGATDVGGLDTLMAIASLPNSNSTTETNWVNSVLNTSFTSATNIDGANVLKAVDGQPGMYAFALPDAPGYYLVKNATTFLLFTNVASLDWGVFNWAGSLGNTAYDLNGENGSNTGQVTISHYSTFGGTSVPEPATLGLLGLGLAGVGFARRRKVAA